MLKTPPPGARRPWFKPLCLPALALLCLLAAACSSSTPAPGPAPGEAQGPDEPGQEAALQKVVIRVLDARDRPVVGAEVDIAPKLGRPLDPGPFRTDARGELRLEWVPEVRDELQKLRSRDQVLTYESKLSFVVRAEGFLDGLGALEGSGRYRSLESPELASLGNKLRLGQLSDTLVLRRTRDLLGPGLDQRPDQDPLVARCLAFFLKYRLVAPRLGAEFAWPSFSLKGSELTLAFAWRGLTWGGLKSAPLAARVAITSGVPLAVAAGKDLLPLEGVDALVVEFHHALPPDNDPQGAPRPAKVVLAAPAQDVRDLARGATTTDNFLLAHPPGLAFIPQPGGQP
jgi:hypothetical protein